MNKPVHYYLDNSDKRIIAAAAYVLDHMGRDFDLSFERVLSKDSAAISIGQGGGMDFFIAASQFKAVCDRERSLNELFMDNDGFPIIRVDHQLDYLLSAFVLLSGMQEWLTDRKDKWERFPFRGSLQDRFGSTEVAWVDVYFQKMYQILQLKLGLPHYLKSDSNVILTHDIDLLRWPIKQNATSYLRSFFSSGYKAKPLASFRELFFNTRKNIDSILALEGRFEVQSVFFWLTERGRGKYGIKNADYVIDSSYVMQTIHHVQQSKGVNALHKSSKAKPIQHELQRTSFLEAINRYHFLLFNLPQHAKEINQSVKQDYSYGFAEEMGFRNSYSLPFHPFDFMNWRPFQFIEVPLHIMDSTFYTYLESSPEQAERRIIDFLAAHRRGSCLSILWHNEFFTPFKYAGWGAVYEEILKFLFEENAYQCLLPNEIEQKYRIY